MRCGCLSRCPGKKILLRTIFFVGNKNTPQAIYEKMNELFKKLTQTRNMHNGYIQCGSGLLSTCDEARELLIAKRRMAFAGPNG